MAKHKSPDPVGSVSGFPYSILWEDFAQLWEEFRPTDRDIAKFEKLLVECAAGGHPAPAEISVSAISTLLAPLELEANEEHDLAQNLYRLAAAYLAPQLRKTLGHAPLQIEKRLDQLVRKAEAFADALEEIDLDVEIVLGLQRAVVDDAEKPRPALFHFEQLRTEARDLAKAAALMSEEMPRRAQGTNVNLLRKRWVRASIRVIESAGTGMVRVLQADAAGRNPRPDGISAEVLFSYLDLVEPEMPDATKVRLILEFTGHLRKAERMIARQLNEDV